MIGAVLYVGDLGRMRTFYVDALGLPDDGDDGEDDGIVVLGPVTLVRSADAVSDGARRSGTSVKLVVAVGGIEARRTDIARLGGTLAAAETTWTYRGEQRCDLVDPEGNVVQLVQRT